MKAEEIVKKRIRQEGLKMAGVGLIWLTVAVILSGLGVLNWMLRCTEKLAHMGLLGLVPGLLISIAGISIIVPGPGLILAGLYQWITGRRTRFAPQDKEKSQKFRELLTQEERTKFLTVKEAPAQPTSKSEALDSCPFCAVTIISHVGDENHCNACGAIWKVMVPLGFGAALLCILLAIAAIGLVIHHIIYFFHRILSLIVVIGATAIALGLLWGAYSILTTRKRDQGLKIVVVRKPISQPEVQNSKPEE
ncbi:MAG: hypothetical protein ABSH14_16565 [Verrucomicrobiia bacterium]